jgi:Tol biopolymer transport system component
MFVGSAGSATAAVGDITVVSTSDTGTKGNRESREPQISDDGTVVAFRSKARNLDPADTDGIFDIYAKNLITGDIALASITSTGTKSDGTSEQPTLSANGSLVAFQTKASNLAPNDLDTNSDIYVKDLATGALTLVSQTKSGTKSNGVSDEPDISADGTVVSFRSTATNLDPADPDLVPDVYEKNLITGDISLVSANGTGVKGNAHSGRPSLSSDGSLVAFRSRSTDLLAADTDSAFDIYLKNMSTGALRLVSADANGVDGDGASTTPMISSDGTLVAFRSSASNLVSADTDAIYDIYAKNMANGAVALVSTTAAGTKSNGSCVNPSLSADGTAVAFGTFATNFDPRDTDTYQDAYVKDLSSGTLVLASVSAAGTKGNANTLFPWISGNGSRVVFRSDASNLVAADTDHTGDVYVKQVA